MVTAKKFFPWMLGLLLAGCQAPLPDSQLSAEHPAQSAPYVGHEELFANLKTLVSQDAFLFGQQRATLSGVGKEGQSPWSDWAYGIQSPDTEEIVGQAPAVLGMDVWDYAMKNPSWNQDAYARAAKDFYAEGKGGLISFEWHMRACDVPDQVEADGSRGVPGLGFQVSDWAKDSNRTCLCRIVNEEPWTPGKTWKDWLFTQKLDRFARKLKADGLDQVPLLFRPYHEMNGSWFWWGYKSWDCQQHLKNPKAISGVDAYKKLFQMTVDHLRQTQRLSNLIITFSPDKLCTHEGHTCDPQRTAGGYLRDTDYYVDFLNLFPGAEWVDVLGLDLYFPELSSDPSLHPQVQATRFLRQLRVLSQLAKDYGKFAALTETGTYNLHSEEKQSLNWFTQYLLPLMTLEPDLDLIYALVWENRAMKPREYYIPPIGHAAYKDFKRFIGNQKTLMYDDIQGLYESDWQPQTTDIRD